MGQASVSCLPRVDLHESLGSQLVDQAQQVLQKLFLRDLVFVQALIDNRLVEIEEVKSTMRDLDAETRARITDLLRRFE